jgi:hypothetical protein
MEKYENMIQRIEWGVVRVFAESGKATVDTKDGEKSRRSNDG